MDESPQQADWRRWLEEHAPKFLLFARQQARSEADAQDLVQEAVVEAAQRQNERPPTPAGAGLCNRPPPGNRPGAAARTGGPGETAAMEPHPRLV